MCNFIYWCHLKWIIWFKTIFFSGKLELKTLKEELGRVKNMNYHKNICMTQNFRMCWLKTRLSTLIYDALINFCCIISFKCWVNLLYNVSIEVLNLLILCKGIYMILLLIYQLEEGNTELQGSIPESHLKGIKCTIYI